MDMQTNRGELPDREELRVHTQEILPNGSASSGEGCRSVSSLPLSSTGSPSEAQSGEGCEPAHHTTKSACTWTCFGRRWGVSRTW